jgi:hypothetical protein
LITIFNQFLLGLIHGYLDYSIYLVHRYSMLLPKPDPYDKARRIILFLGAASLVTALFKLFSPRGDMVDKENKKE